MTQRSSEEKVEHVLYVSFNTEMVCRSKDLLGRMFVLFTEFSETGEKIFANGLWYKGGFNLLKNSTETAGRPQPGPAVVKV